MTKRNVRKQNQKGFTLIEIISVLVILGVLAAVAVPKFYDLQTSANNAAVNAAAAEAQARLNQVFGTRLLAGDSCANALTAAKGALAGAVAGTGGGAGTPAGAENDLGNGWTITSIAWGVSGGVDKTTTFTISKGGTAYTPSINLIAPSCN